MLEGYDKLKELCDIEIKNYPELEKKYKKEISVAKRFYTNGRDLVKELTERKPEIDKRYVIPFLLGLTDEVIDEQPVYVQVKAGASGGIDVDTDWQPEGRDKIYNYLKDKYGEERVLHVGTFSSLGPASAAKDILRANNIDFGESNEFTKVLEKTESWEENLKRLEAEDSKNWKFYQKHKEILDDVDHMIGKIRQSGKHAGGIVVCDKPIYNYVPVDRVNGEPVTAFPESGSKTVLDEIGIIKYDILGISILDVMSEAIDMIDEELYEVEEDGIIKIVPQSYIDKVVEQL